mmetsp:Transcript_78824/g.223325  ORF Transcript_78824/g.223325 Transcript_78824/m.223325 type:complete len:237 (+) Transcript_78824:560-1270(+)
MGRHLGREGPHGLPRLHAVHDPLQAPAHVGMPARAAGDIATQGPGALVAVDAGQVLRPMCPRSGRVGLVGRLPAHQLLLDEITQRVEQPQQTGLVVLRLLPRPAHAQLRVVRTGRGKQSHAHNAGCQLLHMLARAPPPVVRRLEAERHQDGQRPAQNRVQAMVHRHAGHPPRKPGGDQRGERRRAATPAQRPDGERSGGDPSERAAHVRRPRHLGVAGAAVVLCGADALAVEVRRA